MQRDARHGPIRPLPHMMQRRRIDRELAPFVVHPVHGGQDALAGPLMSRGAPDYASLEAE